MPARSPALPSTHGLSYDPDQAVNHLASADPHLARVIEQAGPFTLQLRPIEDVFQPLLRSIVYQQLSGKAAATIYGRVEALAGGGPIRPETILALTDESLRAAGLSRNKMAAARDLASKVLDGALPSLDEIRTMSNEEIIRHLTQVRGIGPWTVEMLLIFSLGRPDVLPVTDLGVRKGYMLAYGGDTLPSAASLLEAGERWRPYRSVASWYFWRAVDMKQLPG